MSDQLNGMRISLCKHCGVLHLQLKKQGDAVRYELGMLCAVATPCSSQQLWPGAIMTG